MTTIQDCQDSVKNLGLGDVRSITEYSGGQPAVIVTDCAIVRDDTVTDDARSNPDFLKWLLDDFSVSGPRVRDCAGGFADAIRITGKYGGADGFTIDAWDSGLMVVMDALLTQRVPSQVPTLEPWRGIARAMITTDDVDQGYQDWCESLGAEPHFPEGMLIGMAAYRYEARKDQASGSGTQPNQPPAGAPPHQDERKMTVEDYLKVLHSVGYTFRRNVLDDSIQVLGNGANWDRIGNALESKIKGDMNRIGYRQHNVIKLAWEWHAYDQPFHPIRDYFSHREYDGGHYIETLAGHFTDQHGVFPRFFRRWLIGVVAKVFEAAQNPMLVLDGIQGLGKSYFCRWLASPMPDHFIEAPINPEDKDSFKRLMTSWIWEVGELGSTTRRADREALKHFLTVQQVTIRLPYAQHDMVKPAMASFIGTINNESGFLSDPTGHRRFVPCHITGLDWGYSQTVNPDDIWAEAYELYLSGEPWQLTASERAQADAIAVGYEVADPLEDLLQTVFEIDAANAASYAANPKASRIWFCSSSEVLDALATRGWHDGSQKARAMQLASVATKLGIIKGKGEDALTGVIVRGYWGLRYRVP